MTVEEVVKKVGFPVFVSFRSSIGEEDDLIIDYEENGFYIATSWVLRNGRVRGLVVLHGTKKVVGYQALSGEPCYETNECSCPTLLNGHHQDCNYRENK